MLERVKASFMAALLHPCLANTSRTLLAGVALPVEMKICDIGRRRQHTVAWRDDDDDDGGNDDDNHVDDDDEEEEADSDDEMIKRRIAGVQSNRQLQRIKWQI